MPDLTQRNSNIVATVLGLIGGVAIAMLQDVREELVLTRNHYAEARAEISELHARVALSEDRTDRTVRQILALRDRELERAEACEP